MARQKIIVALVGALGAGKDTVAKHLVEQHDFRRFAFADEIKRNYYATSGYSEEKFKAARGTPLELEIRDGLWKHSDYVKCERGSLYFVDLLVGAILDCKLPAVVTDIRTHDELCAMRSMGANIVLVMKIKKGNNSNMFNPEENVFIPGSRLKYGDVEKRGDKLFLNYECVDQEARSKAIEMFCRHSGILRDTE